MMKYNLLGGDLARATAVIVTSLLEHHRPDIARKLIGLSLAEGIVVINADLGTNIEEKSPKLRDLVYQLCVAIHEGKQKGTSHE